MPNAYCSRCSTGGCLAQVPQGASFCPVCGGSEFLWLDPPGTHPPHPGKVEIMLSPKASFLELSSRDAVIVRDVGRFGADSTVMVPAGDVVIMRELSAFAGACYTMAARLTQLTCLSDGTRKLIKALRSAAIDAQEEIETRRGL
jgi:hypothetical protein